ncbi:facilitated trehalose transporter Tret1-like isoform X1 [Athalia rosae]|uniref:facilitated trehalose transporter Tret1-like isoform X1 n=1 Tax=Athalia rosae TaxID=37344 RepID=UPI002034294A|nr:facilitated trehalose transporter Tret1-like isoform X1 [Athalia rosae]
MVHLPKVPKLATATALWPQWLCGTGAAMAMIVMGLMQGWSSPVLARLLGPDSPLPITETEASWVASLMNIGRLLGGIAAPFSVEYFGGKRTLFLIGFPTAVGWICCAVADHVAWLYVARILCGAGMGATLGAFPLYVGEISDPCIRGALVTLVMNGGPFGGLLGTLMGTYLTMRTFAIISLVPTTIFVVVYALVPESPHHLFRIGKTAEAELAFQWYHRRAGTKEMEALKQFVSTSSTPSFRQTLREFCIPRYRKAGIIILVLFMFMHISGVNSFIVYMEIILTRAKVTSIAPSSVVVIGGAASIVIGWVAIYTIERCGRKLLLIISSAGTSTAMIMLGVHFTLIQRDPDIAPRDWLPISSVIIFQIFFCLGLLIVPSTILSELFPSHLKSTAALIGGISSGGFAFISTKSYQPMVDAMGENYVFWTYAGIAILAIPFTIFCLPETQGKTLQEIQEILRKGEKETKTENGDQGIS